MYPITLYNYKRAWETWTCEKLGLMVALVWEQMRTTLLQINVSWKFQDNFQMPEKSRIKIPKELHSEAGLN